MSRKQRMKHMDVPPKGRTLNVIIKYLKISIKNINSVFTLAVQGKKKYH